MNKIYQKPFPGGKNAGFTLIELLVVVLIIGILAAIALPQYQKAVFKSRAIKGYLWFNKLEEAQKLYYMANGRYAERADELDFDFTAGIPKGFSLEFSPAAHYSSVWDRAGGIFWELNYNNSTGKYAKYGFFNPSLKYARQTCRDLGGTFSHASAASEYWIFPNR